MKTSIIFKVLLIIALIGNTQNCIAQDTIVIKNNFFVFAKVTEVSTDEVKYIKFDNANGPTYSNKLYEISIIKYQNGVVENYNIQEPIMVANSK